MPTPYYLQNPVLTAITHLPTQEVPPASADLNKWRLNGLFSQLSPYNIGHVKLSWAGHHLVNANNPQWAKDEPMTVYPPLYFSQFLGPNGATVGLVDYTGILTDAQKKAGWKVDNTVNSEYVYINNVQSGIAVTPGTVINSNTGAIMSSNVSVVTPVSTSVLNPVAPVVTNPVLSPSTQAQVPANNTKVLLLAAVLAVVFIIFKSTKNARN